MTLVELLVVMVILSIALSLVVPNLGKGYDGWVLRSAGLKTTALFRLASDTARREGASVTAYYDDHRLTFARNGSIYRQLEIPDAIHITPQKPYGAVFLPGGQIVTSEPFVLENSHGRKMEIVVGPLPGQVDLKAEAE